MKIVITGGCGYIGSSLIKALGRLPNCRISVFDSLRYNQGTLISSVLANNPRVVFFQEDVREWSSNLCSAIASADVIIPLAALVGAPLCDKHPVEARQINAEWVETLSAKISNQLVIYPNTNSGYGSTGDKVCTEKTALNPLSLYAQTKDESEKILLAAHPRVIVFRLATVFGYSYRPRTDLLVNNLIKVAKEEGHITVFDGHFRRNYVHVLDVCEAFLFAIENHALMLGNVYNLGNDKLNTTKLNLVEKICNKFGATFNQDSGRTDPDKRDYLISCEKLYNLGYTASRDLDDGIKEMNVFYDIWDPSDDDKCKNY